MALANLHGGLIFIGVSDNKQIIGWESYPNEDLLPDLKEQTNFTVESEQCIKLRQKPNAERKRDQRGHERWRGL